jgi:threonine/homoserine/homoserine lactone efflux protein
VNGSLFVTYLAALTVLLLTPGPDMLFCLATGMRGGPRAGFLAAVGTASAVMLHISAAAIGLAPLFRAAPALLDAVRILGAAYLVYLGLRALMQGGPGVGAEGDRDVVTGARAYRRGVITNLLNPKMALFTIAFLPQFVDPQAGSVAVQLLVLGLCFVALEIAVDGTVGIVAGRLARLLRRPSAWRTVNVASGSIFLGLGAKLALAK